MPTVIDRHTVEQYYEVEYSSDLYYEYIDGQTIEMDWETVDHNEIVMNLLRAAFEVLGRDYHRICLGRIRLRVDEPRSYLHPDLSIAPKPGEYEPGWEDTLCNPQVVFEVLSSSTEKNDRGLKFELYQKIPSLMEYLLISQEEAVVERFARGPEGCWSCDRYLGLESEVEITTLDWKLPLSELYADIEFRRNKN